MLVFPNRLCLTVLGDRHGRIYPPEFDLISGNDLLSRDTDFFGGRNWFKGPGPPV